MTHGARGLIFIMNERHENWRREADEDRRAMYKRPDAEPLPAEEEATPRRTLLRLPRIHRRRPADAKA
ncbi:MAG TPA: hypothetical protein VIH00_06995 [Candidatus Limnocylindrales bacterium]